MQKIRKIEVCFSPAIYSLHHNEEAIVVVVDILRATSGICSAFINGVKGIIPVGSVDDAKNKKEEGYLLAAERDGIVLDFADFGNSPYNFTEDRVKDKIIAYSTTNGTNAVKMASSCREVLIGSFLNISAIVEYLKGKNQDVVVFCAGWKNRFSLEDSLFAGALSQLLIDSGQYETICDSAVAAMDMWSIGNKDVYQYVLKSAQKQRLAKNGLDDVIEYCCTLDTTDIIPYYNEGVLKPYNLRKEDAII